MSRKQTNVLVTGGAGFIGSNFIHYLFNMSSVSSEFFGDADFSGTVVNVDNLTYAGNLESLKDVEERYGSQFLNQVQNDKNLLNQGNGHSKLISDSPKQRYFFEKADITNKAEMERIFNQYNIDTVIHFAAESHVDRSIHDPEEFIKTNVIGTFTLLEVAKKFWQNPDGTMRDDVLFHHISTDEVYGSLGKSGYFKEDTPFFHICDKSFYKVYSLKCNNNIPRIRGFFNFYSPQSDSVLSE